MSSITAAGSIATLDHRRPRGQSTANVASEGVPRRRLAWLAVGTFALGTESLVIAGVLPQIAKDLKTSVAATGLLVSAFAIAYAVSAPVMAIMTSRFAPKRVLTAAMIAFTVVNLLAALAPTFGWLMAARIATAVVASSYTPNASAMAGSLAAPHERGRALAIVYLGLSLATVLGVPLGTVIAGLGSWRLTFVFVALLGMLATIGVTVFLPEAPRRPGVTAQQWAGVFRRRPVLGALATTTIFFTGQFAVFTYIAEIVASLVGHSRVSVPVALSIFGIAGFIGTSYSGRMTDSAGPERTARRSALTMAVGLGSVAALTFAADRLGLPVALTAGLGIVILIVWGLGGWAINAPQQMRLLALSGDAGPTVLAANSSALYAGSALGSAVGSVTVAVGGLSSLGVIGALLALAAALSVPRPHA
jgi:predicted MFS family arabinose efflux permease